MKFVFLFLLSICLLCSCNQIRSNNEPINKQISQYIRRTCQENQRCQIQIKDATDFSWDKLYVFGEAVEEDEISKILQTNYTSTSPYCSRKWFFVEDNHIVRTEEHILYEIDVPVDNGNVLLTEDSPKAKFSIFNRDSIFEISKNNLDENETYYYLRCINCLPK